MKHLILLALLVFAIAEANHVPEHTLRGPRFKAGYQYKYNVELNVTAGVLGLSSQVSASVLQAEVSVYAKTDTEHILQIKNVRTSGSVKAIENKYGDIPLQRNRDLENKLSSPIKFVLEDGKVTSYTLSRKENLESKKIKKSILRSLEMYIPESTLRELESSEGSAVPVTYNTTEENEYGVHSKHYMITVSPYVDFPYEVRVYNISRVDDFEGEWYPAHKWHHNFQKQGCSEVCRQQWEDNRPSAGCPNGYEPYQSPMKQSFTHEHSLSPVENVLNPEVITTVEVHYAKMYDQDMEVLIRYRLTRAEVSRERIEEEDGQQTFTDLQDMESEINEDEIDEHCNYKKSEEAVRTAKELLEAISAVVVEGELEADKTALIGEKIILLREALSKFEVADFKNLARQIIASRALESASDIEKVKRQIWLDILPVVGTPESMKFIVRYVQEELKSSNMLTWEAKEILEALPQNIIRPDADTIAELKKLTQNPQLWKNSAFLHSAVHLTLAKTIANACGNTPVLRDQPREKSSWFGSLKSTSKDSSVSTRCPEGEVANVIQEISKKLADTHRPEEIVVYIETLAHIGSVDVLSTVSEYVYGTAQNIQEFSPRFIDFIKSMTLHALHNIVGKHPEEVSQIALPVFFNETESPKIRNAAFGVLIRSQPSLATLEKVATHSWFEKSYEVGSFVTSTLETFGNSSLPCMQTLSHRIKTVLPHVRRFDVGVQHAKNYMWTYFDDLRDFGLEGRFEYTPNNESYIPSTLYNALSYSIGSLKDVIFQSSLNMEGLTEERILEKINNFLNIENIQPIENEEKVFGEGKKGLSHIQPRTVEELRFTTYQKMFYKSSYNYFDYERLITATKELSDLFSAYLKKSKSEYSGYLVKLLLPSSYHTIAVAKTLPYPVEFQMRQPIVFALGVQTTERSRMPLSHKQFSLNLKPSVYWSKHFTHQMKNLEDCKEVGVYHEHRVAVTYPFELTFEGMTFPNFTFKYKVPSHTKRVLTCFTESGTYAGKKDLETLPSTYEREPIRTLPTPFKFEKEIRLVGLPPLHAELHSEDIHQFVTKIPRCPIKALHAVVNRVLNAGWRYKSANITILEDQSFWTEDTEATFNFGYNHKHVTKSSRQMSPQDSTESQDSPWSTDYDSSYQYKQTDSSYSEKSSYGGNDEDWSQYLKPSRIRSLSDFAKNAKAVWNVLNNQLPHMTHFLNVSVATQPLGNVAYFKMEFNHTYQKDLYSFQVAAAAKQQERRLFEMKLDHLIGYWNRPDEFKYDTKFGKQGAGFLTAIHKTPTAQNQQAYPWENVDIAFVGNLHYASNKEVLESELVDNAEEKYFLPEKHEECLNDVKNGNPLSIDCVKAIREFSLFNKLNMHVLWEKELPKICKQYARVVDIYLKHYFFDYMNFTVEDNEQKKVELEINYIDKFVDEPVLDLEIKKPSETVTFRRIPVKNVQPLSSVYGLYETSLLETTNNTYPPTCALMENYIQTYDLKTYPFAPRDCYYVLSTHCTQKKNFAVLLRGTREIHIHVSKNTLILSPMKGSEPFAIRYNGKDYELREPVLFNEDDEIYAYPLHYERGHDHVKVVAKKAGISVLYGGKNVKIQVSPFYKGELCGLCSEFDGEEVREFRGMDRCLYKDYVDFSDSSIVKREGRCQVERLRDARICDNESKKLFWESHSTDSEGYEPNLPRNLVVSRGNDVCFSVHPVKVCKDGDAPTETDHQRIGFHCLPKRDLTAKRMISEAKWRTLDEVARKSVDYVERVEVPKKC